MRYYELGYLIAPNLSEEELKSFSEKINSLIQEQGGVLGKISKEKKTRLGYSIKDKSSAFLTTLTFHLKPERLNALEKQLEENKQILRYFILKKKEPKKLEVIKKPLPKVKVSEDKPKKAKVELKDIEKKLEEILEE
jgi:small subunit ribosomal protein S6